MPTQHGACGHEDRGDIHADGAHQKARYRLVTPTKQYSAVNRMGAKQFFRLHREEIAIEHGGGFDKIFGERERGQFHWKAARLPDAALHLFSACAQMRMTRIGFAPCIDDGNDRFTHEIFIAMTHLQRA